MNVFWKSLSREQRNNQTSILNQNYKYRFLVQNKLRKIHFVEIETKRAFLLLLFMYVFNSLIHSIYIKINIFFSWKLRFSSFLMMIIT